MKKFTRCDLDEWFEDRGILDGLLAKKMMDKNSEAEFPRQSCLNAYRRGYRLGEKVRQRKQRRAPQ